MTATSGPGAEDIAIIGLGCLYPDAPDVGTFWRNILAKRSAISNPPAEAWDDAVFYDAASKENDRVYCRKGGYLGPLAYFDPVENGIMPRAVEGGEPDQWLALRVAREALRDAGYGDTVPKDQRAALILGKGTYANRGTISVVYHGVVVDYTLQLLKSIHPELTDDDLGRIRADLKRTLPRFDAETAPALISNVAVGRIANRLDLMGPSYTVDAACASSLVAVDIAVKGLRHREYDLALVGGMQVATPVPVLSLFCRLNALSAAEDIRPFDKDADGTLLSEGVGIAVLKRRSDAERDGDRIYAFVKSTGVASDGRAVSVLAPRLEGEVLALRQAYEGGGISPDTVGLVEAHGTATLVGDATEVQALGQLFGARSGVPRTALGSVKSMIGHTMPAAGMAGLIKAALAAYHKVLPPTLGVSQPSPRLELERTPFYINTETRPWIHGGREFPRRAGVNAFGFGGINAHVIIEEAPETSAYAALDVVWDSEVCVFAAATREALIAEIQAARSAVQRVPTLRLADLAWSINRRFTAAASREVSLGIVATSTDDLARKLERAAARLADPACQRIREVSGTYFSAAPLAREGRLAFLFPGEGAQYLDMLADLCRHFPQVRACFDDMDRHFAGDARGFLLSDLVYPPPSFTDQDRAAAQRRLFDMDVAVEAVYTANRAIYVLLRDLGITPDAMLGHSTGEYAAMSAAGMVDAEAYEARVQELNQIYRGAAADGRVPVQARLIAVGASREKAEAVAASFGGQVSVAMDNCRHQVVLIAAADAADGVEDACRGAGLLYERLAFDRPYHTPAFADYADGLRGFLDALIVRAPAMPVYSATSAAPYPSDLGGMRQLAYEHWLKPVEFRKTIERMHDDGVRLFVEAGPRGNLTAFVEDILAGRTFSAMAANVSRRTGITQLNHLLAQLVSHAVPVRLDALYARRRLIDVDLANPVDPHRPARPLGRVKIATGAPEMRMSPEVVALVRARAHAAVRSGTTQGPVVVPVDVVTVAPAGTVAAAGLAIEPGPAAFEASAHATQVEPAPAWSSAPSGEVAPVVAPFGAEVMSAYLGTMEQFLAVEDELISFAFGAEGAATSGPHPSDVAESPAALAFIDAVVSHQPGEELLARCTLDLDRFPCLRDHTLGRDVSLADPDLPAFPVVPFTMLAEMMAQAATVLVPEGVLIEMRDVRVHRWIAVDGAAVTLEMQAQRREGADVFVQIVEPEAGSAPVAEGLMRFGPTYPAPPAARPLSVEGAVAYKWEPSQLYDEAMFHGPRFRGVSIVDAVGPGGAVATLEVLDRSTLMAPWTASGLITDFVLLDQPGQVVGFWGSQYLAERFLVLPFHMASLQLYGPLLEAGTLTFCVAHIQLIGEDRVRAELDVVRGDGTLYARFTGWEDRRFDLPAQTLALLLRPDAVMLSERLPLPPSVPCDGLTARRVRQDMFPRGWLTAHGGLWRRVLAANVLSRAEREAWLARRVPDARAVEWLLGRIAAKDAVREYLQQTAGLAVRAADIELIPDSFGCPQVQGAWVAMVGEAPLVSISHVAGVAVAIAGDAALLQGIGVDLERLGRMQPATARIAFAERELRLLDGFDPAEREAWSLRMWCAKEACAKAMGQGLAPGIHAFSIDALDRRQGDVSIRFAAAGQQAVHLLASTAHDGEWISAVCVTAGKSVRT